MTTETLTLPEGAELRLVRYLENPAGKKPVPKLRLEAHRAGLPLIKQELNEVIGIASMPEFLGMIARAISRVHAMEISAAALDGFVAQMTDAGMFK